MQSSTIAILLVLLIFILLEQAKRRRFIIWNKLRRQRKESIIMESLARQLIGQQCIVEIFGGSAYDGILEKVEDKALVLRQKKKSRIINLDFVVSIQEVPAKKK